MPYISFFFSLSLTTFVKDMSPFLTHNFLKHMGNSRGLSSYGLILSFFVMCVIHDGYDISWLIYIKPCMLSILQQHHVTYSWFMSLHAWSHHLTYSGIHITCIHLTSISWFAHQTYKIQICNNTKRQHESCNLSFSWSILAQFMQTDMHVSCIRFYRI